MERRVGAFRVVVADDHRGRIVRIVIAEDEAVVARRIARLTTEILGPRAGVVTIVPRVSAARAVLEESDTDLLILDLNLEGEEGFDLLRFSSSCAFETIVVSAATNRALEAFEYGVRDFVPKPFSRERLERALHRVLTPATRNERSIEHLGIRRNGSVTFIRVSDVAYIRGAGTRSELVLTNGNVVLHDRMLDRLEGILPDHFERIHKSYIADVRRIAELRAREGSRYAVVLRDGTTLPVGRTKVAALRQRVG
jgi:DNA-binding LytR/AlgR family response regulator